MTHQRTRVCLQGWARAVLGRWARANAGPALRNGGFGFLQLDNQSCWLLPCTGMTVLQGPRRRTCCESGSGSAAHESGSGSDARDCGTGCGTGCETGCERARAGAPPLQPPGPRHLPLPAPPPRPTCAISRPTQGHCDCARSSRSLTYAPLSLKLRAPQSPSPPWLPLSPLLAALLQAGPAQALQVLAASCRRGRGGPAAGSKASRTGW